MTGNIPVLSSGDHANVFRYGGGGGRVLRCFHFPSICFIISTLTYLKLIPNSIASRLHFYYPKLRK